MTDMESQQPTSQPTTQYINFAEDREQIGYWWYEVLQSNDLSLSETIETFIESIVALPEPNIQTPVLVSVACCPSAMCINLPVCVLYGSSGSGKSSVGTLISNIHGVSTLAGSSTFASIRNFINLNRWYDPEDKRYEKNFALIWDDINENNFLLSENLFSLFKSGINRYTSKVMIADKGGKNLEFDTFSLKIISTVNPFWNNPKLIELKRRLLPFYFKPIKADNVDLGLISVDEIMFQADIKNEIPGLNQGLEKFWREESNRKLFKSAKQSISRLKNKELPIEIYRLFTDIMATAVVLGYGTTKECVDLFTRHYEYVKNNVLEGNMGLIKIFEEWLKEKEKNYFELLKSKGIDEGLLLIKPKDAFVYLEECYKNGEIGEKIEKGSVEGLFFNFGYIKVKSHTGYVWQKMLGI